MPHRAVKITIMLFVTYIFSLRALTQMFAVEARRGCAAAMRAQTWHVILPSSSRLNICVQLSEDLLFFLSAICQKMPSLRWRNNTDVRQLWKMQIVFVRKLVAIQKK